MKQLTLFALLVIVACNVMAQERDRDTVKVLLLACDTVGAKYVSFNLTEDSGIVRTSKNYPSHGVYWRYAWSVRTKHNSCEGIIDPYAQYGRKCEDYWVDAHYLETDKKTLLSMNIIVWQSIVIN